MNKITDITFVYLMIQCVSFQQQYTTVTLILV